MTILDVVSRYAETVEVFRSYDEQAGTCLCCSALFGSIAEVAEQYHLNLEMLLSDLEGAVRFCKPDDENSF